MSIAIFFPSHYISVKKEKTLALYNDMGSLILMVESESFDFLNSDH